MLGSRINVPGVVMNIASVLGHHRDDFENDEDYVKMVELMAQTVAPIVGRNFDTGAFIGRAMTRTMGMNALARQRDRELKRSEQKGE